MTLYFAPIAEGMGDLLLTLPALRTLIDSGEPTYLVLRSPKQEGIAELIPGLAGFVTEPDFLNSVSLSPSDRFINLRNHHIQTKHIFGSDEFSTTFGSKNIVDVIEMICKEQITDALGVRGDFRKYEPFPFTFRSEARDKILLVPGSAGSFKCWPASNWLELQVALKKENLDSIMLGQPEKSAEVQELLQAGMNLLPTPSLLDAVDVVSSAKAMVAVDTGLMHLSVQQKKPTVALFMERSIFVRREENCFPVFAPDCVPKCLGWTQAKPNPEIHFRDYSEPSFADCSAGSSERCMNQISVDQVLTKLLQSVNSME